MRAEGGIQSPGVRARWPLAGPLEESAAVKLRALRGAVTVPENDAGAILDATEDLVRAVIDRNGLSAEQIVSCLFTCTGDLNAEFPAVAARRLGLNEVPLMCAREMDVPGATPGVIRLILHCYTEESSEPQHVYLGEAQALRADLHAAQ